MQLVHDRVLRRAHGSPLQILNWGKRVTTPSVGVDGPSSSRRQPPTVGGAHLGSKHGGRQVIYGGVQPALPSGARLPHARGPPAGARSRSRGADHGGGATRSRYRRGAVEPPMLLHGAQIALG